MSEVPHDLPDDELAEWAIKKADSLLKRGILMTIPQAAERLGYSIQAITKQLNKKQLPDLRVGRARFTLASEVARSIEERDADLQEDSDG